MLLESVRPGKLERDACRRLGIAADLGRLGDALEAAAHDQLARRRWSRLLRSRRSVIAIAVAGIVIPAAAVGAARLIGGH